MKDYESRVKELTATTERQLLYIAELQVRAKELDEALEIIANDTLMDGGTRKLAREALAKSRPTNQKEEV